MLSDHMYMQLIWGRAPACRHPPVACMPVLRAKEAEVAETAAAAAAAVVAVAAAVVVAEATSLLTQLAMSALRSPQGAVREPLQRRPARRHRRLPKRPRAPAARPHRSSRHNRNSWQRSQTVTLITQRCEMNTGFYHLLYNYPLYALTLTFSQNPRLCDHGRWWHTTFSSS